MNFWKQVFNFLCFQIQLFNFVFVPIEHLVNFEDFVGEWNRSARRKPPTYSRDLVTLPAYSKAEAGGDGNLTYCGSETDSPRTN